MKLFFTLLLFTSSAAFCQQKEYLVKNNGDTVWGNINLKNKIFYVTSPNATAINADNVSMVKSEIYKGTVVFSGNLLTYSDNLYDFELDYINKGITDTVLLLEPIYSTPKINLYYGTNDYKTPFYFYKTPSNPKPVQLVVRFYLEGGLSSYFNEPAKYLIGRGRIVIAEDKGYVNQLYAIMGNCKNISQTTWELLSYRSYSLKQLIKKYNACD